MCVESKAAVHEFAAEPPTKVTVKFFHNHFETEGFVHVLHKQQY